MGKKKPESDIEGGQLPPYVQALTEDERLLALEIASPFTGKSKSLNTPALCASLGINPEQYYAALKKKDFHRYIRHLQQKLFAGMAQAMFNRQLLAGVAKGDTATLKLFADERKRRREERAHAEAKSSPVDEKAVDRLLVLYEKNMGDQVRANTAGK